MEQLAEEYSAEGTTSSLVDLGWIEEGDLDPALESAVWDLEVGDVSDPIPGRGGFHILQLEDRQQEALLEFADVADRINQSEHERLMMEEYDAYLGELRGAAYIRIGELPSDAKGFNIQESASRLTLESELPSTPREDEDEPMFGADDLAIDPSAVVLDPDG